MFALITASRFQADLRAPVGGESILPAALHCERFGRDQRALRSKSVI
jgi:hypothetical protein